ncbi:hypothetical protein [Motilibacter rhizosphaerae]|uniref:hypothetical protein n=1 Tax=Motilibacter rhizosphaerae TaxID=598652 RepID=UPI00102B94F7|nr:hypothetical protein [Motilibacter rhizosphaerae]
MLLGAPGALRAPLVVVSVAGTVLQVVPRGRRGRLDELALAVGGVLVLLVLLGVVLDLVPAGLTRTTWALGYAVVALGLLAAPARASASAPGSGRPAREAPRWWSARTLTYAVALAVAAGAAAVAVSAAERSDTAPLALALDRDGGSWAVVISSDAASGPYDLQVVTDRVVTTAQRDIRVLPGHPVRVGVQRPAARTIVRLVRTGSTSAFRTLVLDPSTDASPEPASS